MKNLFLTALVDLKVKKNKICPTKEIRASLWDLVDSEALMEYSLLFYDEFVIT